MSEIFNVIILNLPQFQKILGVEEKLFYPELRPKLVEVQKIWDFGKNVNEFVTKYLNQAK